MTPQEGVERPVYIWQAGERRLARMESFRAIAATALVSGHIWGAAHFYVPAADYSYFGRMIYGAASSIYVLLALTGYLLAWPFVRQYFGGGKAVRLRGYYTNRFLRLFPLYWTAIVLLLILQEGGGSREQWLLFIPLLQNFSAEHIGTVDGPLWTVVVELHFYILLPLLMLGVARAFPGRAGRAAAAIGLLGAASLALWISQVTFGAGHAQLWRWNLPANFFFFASGILLAFFRLWVERERPRFLEHRWLGHSDVWFAASLPIWLVFFAEFKLVPLVAIAGFILLGAATLPLRRGLILRMLDFKPLAVLGVASYSLYVWHLPILDNLRAIDGFPLSTASNYAIVLPICVLVALLSFRFIEAPFLRLRQRWSPASAPIDRQAPTVEVTEAGTPAPQTAGGA